MIRSRSVVVRQGAQAATPLAIVLAVYLFFAGHNQPGGGFAAGLVLGVIVAIRTVAGLRKPGSSMPYLAFGGLIVCAVAIVPLFFGREILDQVVVEGTLPLLGKVKSGSAAIFDLGVTLIVVGLVAVVLDSLADFGDANERDDDADAAAASSRALRGGAR